jgi:hypothetical protein
MMNGRNADKDAIEAAFAFMDSTKDFPPSSLSQNTIVRMGYHLGRMAKTAKRLRTRAAEAEAARDKLRDVLGRIRGWDMLDVTGDGLFWKREIDEALSPAANGPEPTK